MALPARPRYGWTAPGSTHSARPSRWEPPRSGECNLATIRQDGPTTSPSMGWRWIRASSVPDRKVAQRCLQLLSAAYQFHLFGGDGGRATLAPRPNQGGLEWPMALPDLPASIINSCMHLQTNRLACAELRALRSVKHHFP